MFKSVFLAALLMAASVAQANNSNTAPAKAEGRKLPVIIKTETIKPSLCRLHFADGQKKDVACKKQA